MPRRSAADLSVIPGLRRIERIRPPAVLTQPQAQHFARMVAAKPADFFQASDVPLMVQLCRHLARADEIECQFASADALLDFDLLARMADRESKMIVSLLTRMRLTPQARYRPDSAKHHASGTGDPINALLGLDDD